MPKIVCIEELREFRIDVDDMHISLLCVPDRGLIIDSYAIAISIDPQRPIDFKLQSVYFASASLSALMHASGLVLHCRIF